MPVSGKILLELRFTCTGDIRNLPHYHGPQWHGMFETLLKQIIPDGIKMAEADIWLHPVETGVCRYRPGDPIHAGLTFPEIHVRSVFKLIRGFNECNALSRGHFQPVSTLLLNKVVCRVSGKECEPDELDSGRVLPLEPVMLENEIEQMSRLDDFSILFSSPLRCKRPNSKKQPGHKFMDPDFFLDAQFENRLPMAAFIDTLAEHQNSGLLKENLRITGGALTMIDNTYGKYEKPVGGTLGTLRISGRLSPGAATALVYGQYLGIGKNRSFGLGFYEIPELEAVTKVKRLSRGKTLLDRICDPEQLSTALAKLPGSSPGPDGLSKKDMQKAGREVIDRLAGQIRDQSYCPGSCKKFRLPKKDGSFREVAVQNYMDRIVQRAAADVLAPATDAILSRSTYAFRKGLNRKGAGKALKDYLKNGYTAGIKTDISAFFDSVDTHRLKDLLKGLFASDPAPDFVIGLINEMNRASGDTGLPQGSPLSPLLSNLYLDRFDKMVIAEGFKLVRYSDDFVVLAKPAAGPANAFRDMISEKLSLLGLRLSEDKTQMVSSGKGISFLGYCITPESIQTNKKEIPEEDDNWLPVFKKEWLSGHPVYISSISRGAYSSGASLFINFENDKKEKIPWKQISRIVVVGRSSLSGGVLYRAVREEIPVTFIDVMGKFRGHLLSGDGRPSAMVDYQRQMALDSEFCLDFAQKIIEAQIHNRAVVLRRYKSDVSELMQLAHSAESAESIEQLRGFEGIATRIFFQRFAEMTAPFVFVGRKYHPPPDPLNAMLSFGYTLLRGRLTATFLEKGFDPWTGFYHQRRSGHEALVSDVIEELRHIVERMVLTLIHRKEITPDEFEDTMIDGKPACRIQGNAFRKIVRQFENIMALESSYQGETMSINAYLDEMADTLRRSIKLKISYTPLRIY